MAIYTTQSLISIIISVSLIRGLNNDRRVPTCRMRAAYVNGGRWSRLAYFGMALRSCSCDSVCTWRVSKTNTEIPLAELVVGLLSCGLFAIKCL